MTDDRAERAALADELEAWASRNWWPTREQAAMAAKLRRAAALLRAGTPEGKDGTG